MNTYELTSIIIDTSSGSPVVTVAGRGLAPESSTTFPVAKSLVPQGQPLVRANAVVQDALTYLSAQFGVTVTLPGA